MKVCPIKPDRRGPLCGDCQHEWSVHLNGCLVCRLIDLTDALDEREKELRAAALVLRSVTHIDSAHGYTTATARFDTGLLDSIVKGGSA